MLSIVLCTYNGMKYLPELLDSLRTQTLPANELLAFDDGSTDGTPDYIREYIGKYALDGWKCASNPKNLGWKQNFMQGLEAASGDLIFPCDQDDVWHKDKLRLMSECMNAHGELLLLASNYAVNASKGSQRLRKTRYPETLDDGSLVRHAFDKGYLLIDRPGCCYCLRREVLQYKPVCWFEGLPHDAFVYRTADALGAFAILNRQLITFRRHTQNASDRHSYSEKEHLTHMRYYVRVSDALLRLLEENGAPADKMKTVREGRKTSLLRVEMLEKKSALKYARLLSRIGTYPEPARYLKDGAILFHLSGALRRLRTLRLPGRR